MSSERQERFRYLFNDTLEDVVELQVPEVAFAEPMVDHHKTHFDHTDNYMVSILKLRKEIEKEARIIRLKRAELIIQLYGCEEPGEDGASSVNVEILKESKKNEQPINDKNQIKSDTSRRKVKTFHPKRSSSVIDLTGETSKKESPKASEDDDVCMLD